LFIKSQFISVVQSGLYLKQCTNGRVWSWTVAYFERSWGSCEWFGRWHKCAGEASVYFRLVL